jgi:protein SCO1/2
MGGYDMSRGVVLAVLVLFFGNLPAFGAPAAGHEHHHHPGGDNPAKRENAPAPPQAAFAPHEETRWGADYFPNIPLVTHQGKSVRFFDDLIKDKVVVINFMYTSCQDFCPVETAKLLHLQRILGDRVGQDVFMYSITIDPARDTQKVLKEYVEKYKIGPGWLFLTGKQEDITLLRRKLGLYKPSIEEGTFDHNLSIIVGNQRTGKWMKRSPMENTHFLAEQVGTWLHNWKKPPITSNKYTDALTPQKLSAGEEVFQRRCVVCHTIGGGQDVARGNLGPDLAGVTEKRKRAWLTRWIANPAKMLAEKDPIALAIYAQYNELPMPNLGLKETEVAAVLDYMEAESLRVAKNKRTGSRPIPATTN